MIVTHFYWISDLMEIFTDHWIFKTRKDGKYLVYSCSLVIIYFLMAAVMLSNRDKAYIVTISPNNTEYEDSKAMSSLRLILYITFGEALVSLMATIKLAYNTL
ncbi:MAG: hypothetical protein MHMPM18_003991 [Marteilia pararefringens]